MSAKVIRGTYNLIAKAMNKYIQVEHLYPALTTAAHSCRLINRWARLRAFASKLAMCMCMKALQV